MRVRALCGLATALAACAMMAGFAADRSAVAATLAASGPGPISLSAMRTVVTIKDAEPSHISPDHHAWLVIRDRASALPAAPSYDIFLNLPVDREPRENDPGYAGTLNFFDTSGAASPGESHEVSYDVTDALTRLRAAGRLAGPLTVTFIADAPPDPRAAPRIGQIQLVSQ
jgi:hypothetical protein